MAWYWYIGQKVVCIDDRIQPGEPGPYVKKDEIYVINGFDDWFGDLALCLEGMSPAEDIIVNGRCWTRGYSAESFRPVTDISSLIELSNTVKSPEEELV